VSFVNYVDEYKAIKQRSYSKIMLVARLQIWLHMASSTLLTKLTA